MLSKQEIRRLQKENQVLREKNRRQEEIIRHERDLWNTRNGSESGVAGQAATMHRVEVSDEIINNDAKIRNATLTDVAKFQYLLARVTLCMKQDNKSLLFRDNDDRSSDAGNRCKLYLRHALLMALMYKKGNPTQGALAALFGVDQAAVSRYIKTLDSMLNTVLPTANSISKDIANAKTKEEFKKIMPGSDGGIAMVDGTHCPVNRPSNKQMRSITYSGKKKKFTFNTTVCINENGVIVAISKSTLGSIHDITLLRESPLPFGIWWEKMCSEDTPDEDRVHLFTDLGCKGIEKELLGTNTQQPHKRSKNHRHFTPKEKKENHNVNSIRVKVEHSIGRLKRYGRLVAPYNGTVSEFNNEFNIITGLVNLELLWDKVEKGPSVNDNPIPVIDWDKTMLPPVKIPLHS